MTSRGLVRMFGLFVALVCIPLSGCSSQATLASPLDLYGLIGACSESQSSGYQLVSPGELIVDAEDEYREFTIISSGSLDYEMYLTDSEFVNPGDNYTVNGVSDLGPERILIADDGIDIEGPTNWSLTLLIPADQGAGEVTLIGHRYEDSHGNQYEGSDDFVFRLSDQDC